MISVLKKIGDILIVLVIILLIAYFIARSKGIIEIYKVETGSMEDGIHAGDYVLIHKKDNYKIGEIITYKKNDYFITHRIIKKVGKNKVITKGDANNTEDEEITRKQIVGEVVLSGGILNIIINFKYAIVGLLLVFYLLSCYFSDKKKKME